MNVFEAIQRRKSIRSFASTPVPRNRLEKILEAARLAPSAMNRQPWHFVVVTDPESRERIARSGRWARFLRKTPVVIVGCGDSRASPKWHVIDTAIAMQNMVLAATGEGLGTCWIGSFDEMLVKSLLKIPDRFKVVALLAVGYPRGNVDLLRKITHLFYRKKKLSKILSFENFGETHKIS
jgi:nitroreductase